MNIDLQAKRILCYGDSNTWAKIPGSDFDRYPADVRWTGLVQRQIGPGYEVIEEGLNSRSIDRDDPDPAKPGRNGLATLKPTIQSHYPFDICVVMLGTNDLKKFYEKTATDIAKSMKVFIQSYRNIFEEIQKEIVPLILVCPPQVIVIPEREALYGGAEAKSKELSTLYAQVARTFDFVSFVDASMVKPSPIDGVHLTPEGHTQIAKLLLQSITPPNLKSNE